MEKMLQELAAGGMSEADLEKQANTVMDLAHAAPSRVLAQVLSTLSHCLKKIEKAKLEKSILENEKRVQGTLESAASLAKVFYFT